MKKLVKFGFLALISFLLLAACSSQDEEVNSSSAGDLVPQGAGQIETHSATENTESTEGQQTEVGFEMSGESIEEAANVPQEEQAAILEAFSTYIEAFNEEDIDTYMSVISSEPKGFSYETEHQFVKDTFEQYDTERIAEDVTIINYTEQEAQVYANIGINLAQSSTGGKFSSSGRQVTVFAKEDGNWLVTSVYFIRD
ncbi:nuclear transport factor 2 family protein [Chryseomicrobium aureum]|uniref:nuclear transport factor 2 family protein n=1 Tax=Chryseomicrobium aureum TaxID=1441723 RepID=UPI00370D15F7